MNNTPFKHSPVISLTLLWLYVFTHKINFYISNLFSFASTFSATSIFNINKFTKNTKIVPNWFIFDLNPKLFLDQVLVPVWTYSNYLPNLLLTNLQPTKGSTYRNSSGSVTPPSTPERISNCHTHWNSSAMFTSTGTTQQVLHTSEWLSMCDTPGTTQQISHLPEWFSIVTTLPGATQQVSYLPP